MQEFLKPTGGAERKLPPDDLSRNVVVARSNNDNGQKHIAVAGDTYTILLTGNDTAGRFCLIDMLVPPGGGPPSHRHDFEEMFTLLEGEIEFIFRGERLTAGTGDTVSIPANAPHFFKNVSNSAARMLCLCVPAGQEEFFALIGDPVASRTSPAPKLSEQEQAERIAKIKEFAPRFKTEMLVG